MSVCKHELGGSTPQPPDNSNPVIKSHHQDWGQLDQYLTAVQLTSADVAPAMPHSSCLWKQKLIVYRLQLVWLM